MSVDLFGQMHPLDVFYNVPEDQDYQLIISIFVRRRLFEYTGMDNEQAVHSQFDIYLIGDRFANRTNNADVGMGVNKTQQSVFRSNN